MSGIICVVLDNSTFGTIRMHQEREYPGRVSGTDLVNPDFVKLAESFGLGAARVKSPEHFRPALERALANGGPQLIAIDVPRDSETSPWAFIHPPKP